MKNAVPKNNNVMKKLIGDLILKVSSKLAKLPKNILQTYSNAFIYDALLFGYVNLNHI